MDFVTFKKKISFFLQFSLQVGQEEVKKNDVSDWVKLQILIANQLSK